MAFNPQIQDTGLSNFLGASQGTGPDRTFETLFSGLAETGVGAVKMIDAENQLQIQEQARQDFDVLNTEFGLDPGTPSGVSDGVERIQTLQAAFDQGKLTPVNYYGRMAAMAKQLRQRYPGYDDIVDQAVQSATGTRPANAYRDAVMSEIQSAQAEASNEEKFWRQYTKENEAELSLLYGEDYFLNPDKYDKSAVQAEVGRLKQRQYEIQTGTQELEFLKKNGEWNDKLADKVANQEASTIVTTSMNRILQLNGPDSVQKLNEFVASGGGSPQELQQFIGQITELETTTKAELTARLRAKYGNEMSLEQLNKIVDNALYPITEMKTAVLGGDFKLAGRIATINKALTDTQQNQMLQDPTFLAGQGLAAVNNALGEEFFRTNIDHVQTTAMEAAGRVLSGSKETTKQVVDAGNDKVTREHLKTVSDLIVSPNVTGEELSNLIQDRFGPSAVDFMDPRVTSGDDIDKIYQLFLRPEITAAIVSKGSREDIQAYTEWALSKAPAVPAIKALAGDINKVGPHYKTLNTRINDQTGLIEFGEYTGSAMPGAPDLNAAGAAQKSINSLNRVLAVLRPIFEAQGLDPVSGTQSFLDAVGVQLGGGLKDLSDAVRGQSGSDDVKGSRGNDDLTDDIDFEELDFIAEEMMNNQVSSSSTVDDEKTRGILDMIGRAEGAGYNTLFGHSQRRYGVVPTQMTIAEVQALQKRMGRELGSSAFGKYQIMQSTLRDAIKAMNLSPDDVFTPELQDRIAVEFLLKRRGYDKYRAGKMSSSAFLNNLAKEWASVPTTSGRSAYHGDKMGNKATRAGRELAATI